jgi:hypothetical protein
MTTFPAGTAAVTVPITIPIIIIIALILLCRHTKIAGQRFG